MTDNKLKNSFLGNLAKFSIPTVVSALVSIFAIPIITRIYPTEEYGIISLFFSLGGIFAPIITLGLHSSAVRFFYEPAYDSKGKNNFNLAFAVAIGMTLVLGIVFNIFMVPISSVVFSEANRIGINLLLLYIFSTAIYRLQSNYSRLSIHAKNFNIQQICYILGSKVLFAVAAIYSTNYMYAISLMTIFLLIQIFTIGRSDYKFNPNYPGKKARVELFKFALPCIPNDLTEMLNNAMAKLVLSFFGEYSASGIISMATNVANTFNIVSNAFTAYWDPFIYENYNKEKQFIVRVHDYIMCISIMMVIAIFAFQDILYLILGKNYRSSQSIFMLILLMPVQILICATTGYGITIKKKTNINMLISILACIINASTSVFLYSFIGANAVAYSIAISALIQLGLRTIIGQKYYRSIESYGRTAIAILLIVYVCVINVFLYNKLKIRLIVSVLLFTITLIIYRKQLVSLINIIKTKKDLTSQTN